MRWHFKVFRVFFYERRQQLTVPYNQIENLWEKLIYLNGQKSPILHDTVIIPLYDVRENHKFKKYQFITCLAIPQPKVSSEWPKTFPILSSITDFFRQFCTNCLLVKYIWITVKVTGLLQLNWYLLAYCTLVLPLCSITFHRCQFAITHKNYGFWWYHMYIKSSFQYSSVSAYGGFQKVRNHLHYEALTCWTQSYYELNVMDCAKPISIQCLLITVTVDVKIMTTTHFHYFKFTYSKVCIEPHWTPYSVSRLQT